MKEKISNTVEFLEKDSLHIDSSRNSVITHGTKNTKNILSSVINITIINESNEPVSKVGKN